MTYVAEQKRPEKMRRDRLMLICLTMLGIAGIISVSVNLFMIRNKEQQVISTTIQTTTESSNNLTAGSTVTSTNICHMNFKYQSKTYPTGLNTVTMVTGDFNHDCIDDLALTNADSDTINVLLGNNNGTFQTRQIYLTGNGSRPTEIAIGDFDNDTLLDLD
ncbi:unnamed protein product [Adineta steineri]|uniref:VCBS repeat-containing protein n=1 Tax=Adineta steineri TaxID=433720 RepID=A0A820J2W2_9BILA|nr:unnamed protein product [Adineta steineri]